VTFDEIIMMSVLY